MWQQGLAGLFILYKPEVCRERHQVFHEKSSKSEPLWHMRHSEYIHILLENIHFGGILLQQSLTGQFKSRRWQGPYVLLPLSFTANIWYSLCCQFSIFSILLSHLTRRDSATLQWSQNIIYDNLTRLNTQKLSPSISKAYVPKEAWIFSNPAHLTNTCKHFHKARFPLRPRDFQDHLLKIRTDRLEQRISGLQSSCECFNYLCLFSTLQQRSPGLYLISSFCYGFHFTFQFFWKK